MNRRDPQLAFLLWATGSKSVCKQGFVMASTCGAGFSTMFLSSAFLLSFEHVLVSICFSGLVKYLTYWILSVVLLKSLLSNNFSNNPPRDFRCSGPNSSLNSPNSHFNAYKTFEATSSITRIVTPGN